MKRLLTPLLLMLLLTGLSAQTLYNVRVGTFQDVRADEFDDLRELGFIYGKARDGQLTDVYLGNFTTEDKASSVATQLQDRGFRNATPLAIPVAASGEGRYIQIALRARNRRLDWSALERAGKLYVDATDGVTKVVTGPFDTPEAAEAQLAAVREIGYRDAFVRTIPRGSLVPVGVFETGIKKPLIPITLGQAPPPPPRSRPGPGGHHAGPTRGHPAPAASPGTCTDHRGRTRAHGRRSRREGRGQGTEPDRRPAVHRRQDQAALLGRTAARTEGKGLLHGKSRRLLRTGHRRRLPRRLD